MILLILQEPLASALNSISVPLLLCLAIRPEKRLETLRHLTSLTPLLLVPPTTKNFIRNSSEVICVFLKEMVGDSVRELFHGSSEVKAS